MKAITTLLLLLIAGVLGIAVAVPDDFTIERAVSIKASPARVYPIITDLRRFPKWSPWEGKDVEIKRTNSGPASGKGAVYEWNGNGEVTRGRMEVTSTAAPRNVIMKLHMIRPFEPQNIEVKSVPPFKVGTTTEFGIVERGGATVVTWTMRGKYTLEDKIKSVVARMNDVLGYELELGLSRLKDLAE